MFILPCVAKKVLEITNGKHKGFELFQCTHCIGLAVQRRGRSPRNAAGGHRATLNLSTTPLFCGYDVTCAAPSPLIVQRRALCLCNADPCAFPHARAIPIPLPWFHALGPPHLFFCHLQYGHNRVQSDTRYGFGNLPVLNVVIWRIAIIMQTFTELVAIKFSKTAQRNTAYPVHKI